MSRASRLSQLIALLSGEVDKYRHSVHPTATSSSAFRMRRRSFLKASAFGALGLASPAVLGSCKNLSKPQPVVGIVGAGLAGLSTAYQLQKAGINVTVYEASGRPGGRIKTVQNPKNRNLYYEAGGEFIDSNHQSIRRLCQELGLSLYDTLKDAESNGLTLQDYFIEGQQFTPRDVLLAFNAAAPKVAADLESCGPDYDTDQAVAFDNTSLASYVRALPMEPWLAALLISAYEAEYGLAGEQQSSLNFIDMIGTDLSGEFALYGDSDERFKVNGGSGQIITKLVQRLGDSVKYGKIVSRIESGGKDATLHFADGGKATHDILVLALPFSVLKGLKLDIPAMSADKRRCIDQLSYGNNCKLILSFSGRPWRVKGSAGYLVNDTIQNGWDATQGQAGNRGSSLYTVFLGAQPADSINQGSKDQVSSFVTRSLDLLERVYGPVRNVYNGFSGIAVWAAGPYSKGSYPSYSVGQWTTISGYEAEPVGNVFFAGDHTSDAFQGYMNGAAESADRVTQEVLAFAKAAA